MKTPDRRHQAAAAAACAAVLLAAAARPALAANDFPTVERVLYVQECMNGRPGNYYEMVNKCSCALDALAGQLPFDDYVQISTAAKATSIGGERGSYIRDTESLQTQIKRYRELQDKARSGCFLGPDPK